MPILPATAYRSSQLRDRGLGSKASNAEFKDQFPGLTADQAKVTKDGGQINAITGATITSRAVCTAVGAAIEAVGTLG